MSAMSGLCDATAIAIEAAAAAIDELEAKPPQPVGAKSRAGVGGPKTAAGKAASRRNALKHGLRAKSLMPEVLEDSIALYTEEFSVDFKPSTPYQHWLVGQLAVAAARIDRCVEMAALDLRRRIDRADDLWDADRRREAEALGARLARDPARTVLALRQTRQGAEWLIARWECLEVALRVDGAWDETRRGLALDLLGVPVELRAYWKALPADATAKDQAAIAAAHLAALRAEVKTTLGPLDETERSMTLLGMPVSEDAATRTLRRYEAEQRRSMFRTYMELRRTRPRRGPTPVVAPLVSSLPPEAVPVPEPVGGVKGKGKGRGDAPAPPPPPPPPDGETYARVPPWIDLAKVVADHEASKDALAAAREYANRLESRPPAPAREGIAEASPAELLAGAGEPDPTGAESSTPGGRRARHARRVLLDGVLQSL